MIEELDEFIREYYVVNQDETRILFLRLIERSILDYVNLAKSQAPIEQQYFQTAEGFLFDEDYYIWWGDYQLNLEDMLAYLNIDYEWFARKLYELIKKKK